MLVDAWEGMGYMLLFLVLMLPAFMVWSWWDDYTNKKARERIEAEKRAKERALQADDL